MSKLFWPRFVYKRSAALQIHYFPQNGMGRTLAWCRKELQRRAKRAAEAKKLRAKKLVAQMSKGIVEKEKERKLRKTLWIKTHGTTTYKKLWRTCIYARAREPLAALGVWKAVSLCNQKKHIKGSVCSASLKKIDNFLKKYAEKKPIKYKALAKDAQHAVDMAILFKDTSYLDQATNCVIPNVFKYFL